MRKLYTNHNLQLGKLLLLVLTVLCSSGVNSNVIGFDFGQQFFKITLVKPGQPFSIVENTASGRKTHSLVTLTDETRLFGGDSFMEMSKYPSTTFGQLQQVLGQKYSDEFISYLKNERYWLNEFVEDERGLVGFKISRKT